MIQFHGLGSGHQVTAHSLFSINGIENGDSLPGAGGSGKGRVLNRSV